MIKGLLSLYSWNYPRTIIYMLQSSEYQVGPYLRWFWRVDDFSSVMHRRSLQSTKATRLLLLAMRLGIALQIVAGLVVVAYGAINSYMYEATFGAIIVGAYPVVWAHFITLPLEAGRIFIAKPKTNRLVAKSRQTFLDHTAIKIAVAGSYGKTTVKELLLTILSEGKQVAATPANKNVASSHALFAQKLTGDEEVLIIEYGEGQPGDIAKFATTTSPNIGFITGLAPAHLDKYRSVEAAAADIMSLTDFVDPKSIYINAESKPLAKYLKPTYKQYTEAGADGWKVSNLVVTVNGMDFTAKHSGRQLKLSTKLVGRHLVGPLVACVALAAKLGLTNEQIEAGVAKTEPFEHRMQPRLLAGGWVIDDTYNGNLEGVRAGLNLLKDLEAKRKIYVTPGLVDQGKEAKPVHETMGRLIAEAGPDKVVLMKNSVTAWIKHGLTSGGYKGELLIEDDPLNYYTNLDQVIAVGDVVLMQNDWTDNYN